MHFLSNVFSTHKTSPGKKSRVSIASNSTSTSSTMSSDVASISSEKTLYVPPAMNTNYAEMLDDDNMAWGSPKPRKR